MTPQVSVIVCHHLSENQEYLDLCLNSLLQSTGVAIEILCISDAPIPPKVPEGVWLYHRTELTNATKKVHWALPLASPASQYYLFVGDDVMVSRQTIAGLVEGVRDRAIICNPLCNGDNGGRFLADFFLEENKVIPCNLNRQDIMGSEEIVLEWPRGHSVLFPMPYVSFYCTLIPKKVWEAVGCLDERLETRHNDEDYCYRAAKLGIPSMINAGVFALHFGSRTLRTSVLPGEQDAATAVFREKWSHR